MNQEFQPDDSGRVKVSDALICDVLIVVDDPQLLRALQELLDAPDRNIVVAQSGEDALRFVLKFDFAVILLDVKMSGMDGFATARIIRSRPGSRNTPIIFLTGTHQDAVSRFRAYVSEAADDLVHPLVHQNLRRN